MMYFTEDSFLPLYGVEESILCRCRYMHRAVIIRLASDYKT